MKPLLPIILYFACAGFACAQSPRMTVRNANGTLKLLQVEQADISLRFVADIAETVLELNFRNDSERAVEGEFVLPLPPGATVSAYALEVNGKMRDGVAVEKQRARNAYESVKRRMIDPGIVEREAGNIYRTQVYPVPAKGTKRLRITYSETLRSNKDGFTYALPVDFPAALASYSCELRGTGLQVTEAAGLDFAADTADVLKAQLKDGKPAGTLKISVKIPAGPHVIVGTDAQPAFFLSDRMPEVAPRPRPAPDTVMLVWDASGSRSNEKFAAEFSLLDAWFTRLGKTRVKLRLLREGVEHGGEFEIRAGNWAKLKQALQQVDYDGATDISQLKIAAGEADLVVVFGDGITTLGSAAPVIAVPWVFARSGGGRAADASLLSRARSGQGTLIDLAIENREESLIKLTRQPLRVLGVVGNDPTTLLIDEPFLSGQPLRVFGRLPQQGAGKLEIRYGFGDEIVTTREVTYQNGGGSGATVGRLYAQRLLTEMEQCPRPDQARIIEHCKRHGLVSDFTSLIVLERIEDYAEHEIAPPEPELQEPYRKLVQMRAKQRDADRGGLAVAWAARLRWFEQRFAGYEALLLPRLRQVGIWKKALESQFDPAQRDAAAFAVIAGWFEKATDLIKQKPEKRTEETYQSWRRAVDELHAQGPALAQTALQTLPAGQALAVSVRGRVAKPGVVTGESGMTLRQAIARAGGLHALGSLDYVVLYRNAGKVVYNTLSEKYQDIALMPGDMIVVDRPKAAYDGGSDPFSSEPRTPPDPSKQAAVREQADIWTNPPGTGEPFGARKDEPEPLPAASGASFPVTPATPSAIRSHTPPPRPANPALKHRIAPPPKPREVEPAAAGEEARPDRREVDDSLPDFAAFEKQVAAGRDPANAYRKLRGAHIYQERFYLDAARILFAKNHAGLGRRVLSNLVESRPGDLSALRAYAFWLAEFGQNQEAEALLNALAGESSASMPLQIDLASLRGARNELEGAASALLPSLREVKSALSGSLAAIALTEFNAFQELHGQPRQTHPLANDDDRYRKNLAADIRIVVTSVSDGATLDFEVGEPGGFMCSAGSGPTPYGSRVTAAGGLREYMIRRAVPGIYRIRCASTYPTTVRVVIHTHWGRADHTSKTATLWLDAQNPAHHAELEFGFEPQK